MKQIEPVTRLRRSCLAVPGSNPKMMAGAADTDADQVFLDLEDAVAPSKKEAARALVVEALNTIDFGNKVVVVRVNSAESRYMYSDIVALMQGAGDRLDCLMLPKVQDAGQVWFVEHLLRQLEADGRTRRRTRLEIQVESGSGIVNLKEIVCVTPRIEAVVFGPGDYAADLGVPQLDVGAIEPTYPGHQWHYPMSVIVTHARFAGCAAIDGPFGDFRDADGYRQSSNLARLLGMDGKWCIHPSQVSIANEVFTPTTAEVEHAQRILEAYELAVADGIGAISMDGRLIDEASRRMALRTLARGNATEML